MATALRSFSDEFYDGQLERTLAAAYADAADLGEAFAVAQPLSGDCRDSVREHTPEGVLFRTRQFG